MSVAYDVSATTYGIPQPESCRSMPPGEIWQIQMELQAHARDVRFWAELLQPRRLPFYRGVSWAALGGPPQATRSPSRASVSVLKAPV